MHKGPYFYKLNYIYYLKNLFQSVGNLTLSNNEKDVTIKLNFSLNIKLNDDE